ncbi:hypothetical protein [Parvibaculum indicum]|uniref:hypothetical protein n=1 Tax=Parvibaculum indicum TaxID=562969 RepID=UPI0031B62375
MSLPQDMIRNNLNPLYVWQHYDLEPKYPELQRFLDFWDRELEGPIHSVKVATRRLISPSEMRRADFYAMH